MRSDSASVSRFSGSLWILLQSFRARELFQLDARGDLGRSDSGHSFASVTFQKGLRTELESDIKIIQNYQSRSRKEGIPEQDQEVALPRALRCLGSQVWAKQLSSEDIAGRQVVPATCSVGSLSHSYIYIYVYIYMYIYIYM